MAVDLPQGKDDIITANDDYDVVLNDIETEINIVENFDGANNGFDGAAVDIKAPHPNDETRAPIVKNGGAIAAEFTDVYQGQKGKKLRFTVSGAGVNTALRIYAGPVRSG